MTRRILTLNGGSSSIKFAVYEPGPPLAKLLAGAVERIGLGGAVLTAVGPGGRHEQVSIDAPDHGHAAGRLLAWLGNQIDPKTLAAVGHRVVHGGTRFTDSQPVTPELLDELRRLEPIDPDHLPAEIALIEEVARRVPGVLQVTCFDTAFHRDLPRVARLLPIPRRYEAAGVRRYGFHGLSYEYVVATIGAETLGRAVLAHLGSGASLAAVRDGRSVHTTMGFTPAGGIVMSTRSGDVDPGVLVYLARELGYSPDRLEQLVEHEAGLVALSAASADMRTLLDRRGAGDERAALAIEVFTTRVRMQIGGYAALLGGLDTIVFTGGIGANAAPIRAETCAGLEVLGVTLDQNRNAAHAPIISTDDAAVTARVIETDEALTVARQTRWVLSGS